MVLLESLAVALLLLLCLIFPEVGDLKLPAARRTLRQLVRRPVLCAALVGLLALLLNISLSLLAGVPQPAVHDEFCYLLGADTFVAGRVTNPTHPLWPHFESFHLIHQPSYQMKYPPAQALALALGWWIAHPIIGVWLSLSLACAAVCWMLQAWLPARWAMLGGFFPLLRPELHTWWGQSYWGGAAAMLGGALLLGALPRLLKSQRPRDAVLLAGGLLILANSRPYEGLIASLPVAVVLVVFLFGTCRLQWSRTLPRLVAPMAVVLLAGAAAMGYYHFRVTGDPLRMPYQVWQETYGQTPSLTQLLIARWETPTQKATREISLPDVEGTAAQAHLDIVQREKTGMRRLLRSWAFFLGPVFTIPLLACIVNWKHAPTRFALLTCGLVMAAISLQPSTGNPHYAAPVACLLFFLAAQGIRYIRVWRWRDRRAGRFLAVALPALALIFLSMSLFHWLGQPVAPFQRWSLARAGMLKQLESAPGTHLVVVRYEKGHHRWHEWVYNRADIDAARVVWARELTAEQNQHLLKYFADRHMWLLFADRNPPELIRQPSIELSGRDERDGHSDA